MPVSPADGVSRGQIERAAVDPLEHAHHLRRAATKSPAEGWRGKSILGSSGKIGRSGSAAKSQIRAAPASHVGRTSYGGGVERGAEAWSQPRDHADVHGVALGDLGQGLAGGAALDRFLALILGQLRFRPNLTPAAWARLRPSPVRSRIRSRSELGDGSQER